MLKCHGSCLDRLAGPALIALAARINTPKQVWGREFAACFPEKNLLERREHNAFRAWRTRSAGNLTGVPRECHEVMGFSSADSSEVR